MIKYLIAALGALLLHEAAARSCQIDNRSAQDVVKQLNLTSNPEKGYYAQTFVDEQTVDGNRSYSTAIYYLLEGSAGFGYWHQVDEPEVWHHYAGASLELSLSWNNGTPADHPVLGKDIFHGEAPQIVIGRYQWQRARSLGAWTLVGTTVAPGFVSSGYVLEDDPNWEPTGGN